MICYISRKRIIAELLLFWVVLLNIDIVLAVCHWTGSYNAIDGLPVIIGLVIVQVLHIWSDS